MLDLVDVRFAVLVGALDRHVTSAHGACYHCQAQLRAALPVAVQRVRHRPPGTVGLLHRGPRTSTVEVVGPTLAQISRFTEGTVYISVRSEGTRFAHRLRSESHNFERRSTDAPPPRKCMKKVVDYCSYA